MAETNLNKCVKCGREQTAIEQDWAVFYVNGRPQFATCPSCQTDEDRVEVVKHDQPENKRHATDARLFDTETLIRLNQAAVLNDGIALTENAIEDLDRDAQHLAINGASNAATSRSILMLILNIEAANRKPIISASTGEETAAMIEVGYSSSAPSACFLEIKEHEWMGGERVMLEGSEWQETAVEQVKKYLGQITPEAGS